MKLTEDQLRTVSGWIEDGADIGEIQARLSTTFNLHLTYMEVRFLVDDSNWTLKLKESVPTPIDPAPKVSEEKTVGTQKVCVSVDKIARPGVALNGSVTFGDGQGATWQIDGLGRLTLKPDTPGYKPSAEDIHQFQRAVQGQLEGL